MKVIFKTREGRWALWEGRRVRQRSATDRRWSPRLESSDALKPTQTLTNTLWEETAVWICVTFNQYLYLRWNALKSREKCVKPFARMETEANRLIINRTFLKFLFSKTKNITFSSVFFQKESKEKFVQKNFRCFKSQIFNTYFWVLLLR